MKTAESAAYEPGEEPLAALRQVAMKRGELDREEYHHVMRARVAGASWQQIAFCLGVSKQAVHKKFKHRIPNAR